MLAGLGLGLGLAGLLLLKLLLSSAFFTASFATSPSSWSCLPGPITASLESRLALHLYPHLLGVFLVEEAYALCAWSARVSAIR